MCCKQVSPSHITIPTSVTAIACILRLPGIYLCRNGYVGYLYNPFLVCLLFFCLYHPYILLISLEIFLFYLYEFRMSRCQYCFPCATLMWSETEPTCDYTSNQVELYSRLMSVLPLKTTLGNGHSPQYHTLSLLLGGLRYCLQYTHRLPCE